MDNLKLIELVQEKEYLYNKGLNEFRKVELKEATWREIAEKLGVTDVSVKKRWASLRDRFTKELRMLKMADEGRVLLTKEPWSLFDAMYFVKDYVKYRHYNDGSMTESKPVTYEEETYIESPYDEEFRDSSNNDNETVVEFVEQPPRKTFKEDILEENQNDEVEQTYVERVEQPRVPNAQVLGISRIVIHKLNNLETMLQNEAIENMLSYLSALERFQAGLTKVKPKLRF